MEKKIKNQALFKKGGYSIAITAIVLVGIIVFNILVGALSDRFVLDFDMSAEKTNSISKENLEYIKKVKDEITVTMCSTKEDYIGGYMSYYAQQYGVGEDASAYYEQTVKLMEKYGEYNKNISVDFANTQSSEFSAITTKYANDNLNFGDIIVSANKNGTERYKILTFSDIYDLTEDETYAAYGYTFSTVTGNQIETALTGAIAYVTSNSDKKIALLTGHSAHDYTENYKKMLESNNYTVDVIDNNIITEISDKYDAIVIASPSTDFLSGELDVISAFLDNNGNLDKGLIYFADATLPFLPNFNEFLADWGIIAEEGILFETIEGYHMTNEPTTLLSAAASDDRIVANLNYCLTGNNVPLTAIEKENLEVKSLMGTSQGVVAAPIGVANDWKDADEDDMQSYSTVIQSVKNGYSEDNKAISSYVMAFSSIQFIYSEYAEMSDVSNKNIALSATERACNAEDTGIYFVSKSITEENFVSSVSQSSSNIIRIIFVILIPLICIAAGIYIYIKRRNA